MKTKRNVSRTETFELMMDGMPVMVKATSYQTYTMETEYRVSINDGPVYIFAWHPVLKRLTSLTRGNANGNMPPKIDELIAQQLYSRTVA